MGFHRNEKITMLLGCLLGQKCLGVGGSFSFCSNGDDRAQSFVHLSKHSSPNYYIPSPENCFPLEDIWHDKIQFVNVE